MEKEFKWSVPDNGVFVSMLASSELPPIESVYDVTMDARYYDSADGIVNRSHGGLRLRAEGAESVCCLKLAASSSYDGALKSREEYECSAPDIETGLKLLPQQTDAPAELCSALLEAGVHELGRTTFVRHVAVLKGESCTAELSMDIGLIVRGERTAEICEIELELKGGNAESFERLGQFLQERFRLQPQPMSKLARMLHL